MKKCAFILVEVILNLFQDLRRNSIKCHIDLPKQEGILRQAGRQSLSCTNHAQNDMAFKIGTNICHPEGGARRISEKNKQRILRFAQNDKKCAFTLAEVLITLGVIGIVAAMTIPQLITSYKKKVTIERLKTTYSILSQAINMSKEKNGDIDTWDTSLSNIDFAKLYILPYIKISGTITKRISGKYMNLYTLSNQNGSHSNYIYWSNNPTNNPIYIMANGSWFTSTYAQSYIFIVVDINGQGGPNVMGIDGFSFYLDPKSNQLVPTGYGKTRDQLLGKSYYTDACVRDNQWQYYRGGSCAALMMMDGWKMTKDYPWGNGGLTPLNK